MFWKDDEEDNQPVVDSYLAETEKEFGSSDETGSEERFVARQAVFEKEDKPVYKHHFWWFVHNCIAHPAIGILPCRKTFDFHDWTSKKINGK